MKYLPLLFLFSSATAIAQLPTEFAAVACKPSSDNAVGFTIEKRGRDVSSIVAEADGKRSTVVQATGVISNVIRSPQGDFIAYFLVNPRAPKLSGWVLQRLSDGHSEHVIDGQLPPESACFSPDGKKLAYVNQSIVVVQVDLAPAYERLNYRPPAHQ